jgi:CubicO group peptidase (beta-lactamase class C family)
MHALDEVIRWPVDAAAVGVVRTGVPGDPGTVVGDPGRTYPWASVTKPATALAVLVAVEEGTLTLDQPAGPPGSTVRHLLAHASGLGPEEGPPVEQPGRRRIYSNAGFVVLGRVVEEASGMPFADYLSAGVLEPLGMTATGARRRPGTGAAAAGLVGPLVDLVALGREWARPDPGERDPPGGTHHRCSSPDWPACCPGSDPSTRVTGVWAWRSGGEAPHWTGSVELAGHLRPLRPERLVPVGGPGGRGALLRAGRPPLRGVGLRAWPALAEAVLAEVAGRTHPVRCRHSTRDRWPRLGCAA